MNQRATFITSYLYDGTSVLALRQALTPWAPVMEERRDDDGEVRWIAGLAKGGSDVELAAEFEYNLADSIMKALPRKHGRFTVALVQDNDEIRKLTFQDGALVERPETAGETP